MTDSSLHRRRLARRLSWLIVGALTIAALVPVPAFAENGTDPGPNAESIQTVPWTGTPPSCLPGQFHTSGIDSPFASNIDVELANVTSTSFDWTLSAASLNVYDMAAVIVTGTPAPNDEELNLNDFAISGTSLVYFYSDITDDSDTNLVTFPLGTGPHDLLTHIEFCFNQKNEPGPTPTPTPTPGCQFEQCATPTPTPTPTPPVQNCQTAGNCPPPPPTPTPTPAPTPAPTPNPTPTPAPTPTGQVQSATGTPSVTLPPTDSLSGSTSAPSGDSWRLILLAMAGILAATLLLSPTQSEVRRKDR